MRHPQWHENVLGKGRIECLKAITDEGLITDVRIRENESKHEANSVQSNRQTQKRG